MNYNNVNFGSGAGPTHQDPKPLGRKMKRVVDHNAIGTASPSGQPFMPTPNQFAPIPTPQETFNQAPTNAPYNPNMSNQYPGQYNPGGPNMNASFSSAPTGAFGPGPGPHMPQPGAPNAPGFQQQFAVFQQPMVQDMALQYGQKLADQGKQLMENQFEKYVPVTRLKYYFAVDNRYVINKLRLLFFPFTHTDWSLKYDQDNPVQARYDINAPDLYIPTMAYITYVVLAGLVLGMQKRFSPEQLGIQASSALAYSIFEIIIYTITLYIGNISTTLKTLDLLAYSGYKYVVIVSCILTSLMFKRTGYYIVLLVCSLTLGFFLLRTLRAKVLNESTSSQAANDPSGYNSMYGAPQAGPPQMDYSVGRKRKLYFLFLVAGLQPFFSFWLSMHLLPVDVA